MLPQELPSSIHCCRVNFSQPIKLRYKKKKMEECKSQLKNMFYEGGFFGYGLNSVAGVYCSLYSSNIHNMLDFNSSRFFWRLHTHAFFDDATSIIQKKTHSSASLLSDIQQRHFFIYMYC